MDPIGVGRHTSCVFFREFERRIADGVIRPRPVARLFSVIGWWRA